MVFSPCSRQRWKYIWDIQNEESPSVLNIRNSTSQKTLSTEHGELTIDVPRDRASTFEPTIVPKHKTMIGKLDDMTNLLYAKRMSNADIVDFMDKTYGVTYSTSQISVITNRLMEDIKEWQNRPLESMYAITWIDAIHYKIRHEGKVNSKAAMLIIRRRIRWDTGFIRYIYSSQ